MSWNEEGSADTRSLMRGSEMVAIEGIGEVFIAHSARARRLRITVRPSGVSVAVPAGVPISHGRSFVLAKREWIHRHIRRMESLAKARADVAQQAPVIADRRKARDTIVRRLDELSSRHGLPYGRVMVRSQKTLWGSCSTRNTISLNIKLARLPMALMDYVILHELLHTKIRGHKREFWRALDALVGDAHGLRKELRRYGLDLL
jgi:predicted metal-dependent hydrolase